MVGLDQSTGTNYAYTLYLFPGYFYLYPSFWEYIRFVSLTCPCQALHVLFVDTTIIVNVIA